MSRYEFHSALSPELVLIRLRFRTEQGFMDLWSGRDKFVSRRKKDRFWLFYTGKIPVNGFLPFCGRVAPKGDGSLITGSFRLNRGFLPAVAALVFLFGLLVRMPPLIAAAAAAVAYLYFYGWFQLIQHLLFQERRKAVLGFIEKNLLRADAGTPEGSD